MLSICYRQIFVRRPFRSGKGSTLSFESKTQDSKSRSSVPPFYQGRQEILHREGIAGGKRPKGEAAPQVLGGAVGNAESACTVQGLWERLEGQDLLKREKHFGPWVPPRTRPPRLLSGPP